MEVVAFLTLAVAGYIINKRQRAHGPVQNGYRVSLGDTPAYANDDLYESQQLERARKIEFDAATRATAASARPEATGIVPRNFTDDHVQAAMTRRRGGTSELSGLQTDFMHQNMKPFFGGHVRQTIDPTASNDILERYTGMTAQGVAPPLAKIEQATMFAAQPLGNVFGAPSYDLDAAIERLPIQKFKDNDLPFRQVIVGPAIDGGYNATPNDGYLTGREFQMPKDTDELRTLDDPKVSYPGRVIAGAKHVQARGELGIVDEVRYPDRYRETFNADDWMRTTGKVLGEASRPEQLLREVDRPETLDYKGAAGPTAVTTGPYAGPGEQSPAFRSECLRLQLGPASAVMAADWDASVRADYGRANILVYANERDTTNVPVFSGSASTFVKAVVAPLLDLVRPARRQVLGTFAARSFGNTSVTFPDKQTVRDLDGSLRTTIREVTQQVSANPGALGSLRGPTLLPVYDPSDVAKRTLKEQTIHDTPGAFAPAPQKRRTTVREVGDRARTTTRNTLDCTNTSVNPWVSSLGQVLRDPDLGMRTTVKETTISAGNAETDGTSVGGLQRGKGGYSSADMTANPTTTRQFLSMQEDNHIGGAIRPSDDAYLVANAMPRTTQREELSDISYYGPSKGENLAQTSHEEYDHATIRPDKEILSVMTRGDFGPSGCKEAVGVDKVFVGDPRKFLLETDRPHAVGRVMPRTIDASAMGLPEVGGENTCGLDPNEGTRGLRGTYAQEMAMPKARFEEDVSAMSAVRSTNPVANASFSSGG